MADPDQKLKQLFAAPDRGVDRAFVNIIDQHVALEQRLDRARRLAWAKFRRDALTSGTVVAVLLTLVVLGRSGAAGDLHLVTSPTILVLFIFAVWVSASVRPAR